jgi:thioredoxin-like negative regulator of GroEL
MSRTVANVLDSRNRPANYGTVTPDNEFDLTNYLRIKSLPTTLLYRDGVLIAQTSGAMPEYKFTEWMGEHAQ